MLQNARDTFTVSELLRENQQEDKIIRHTQIRVNIFSCSWLYNLSPHLYLLISNVKLTCYLLNLISIKLLPIFNGLLF